MFKKTGRNRTRLRAFLALLFALSVLLPAIDGYAEELPKRIRVGLLAPNTSLSSCELSYPAAHGVFLPKEKARYSFHEALFRIEEGESYQLKRISGTFELSQSIESSLQNYDLNEYPGAVPFVVSSEEFGSGVRLLKASGESESSWQNAERRTITGVGFYVNDDLKFVLGTSSAVVKSLGEEPFTFEKLLSLKGSKYRGGFSVFFQYSDGTSFFPINDLDLESYLYGVVPREMPTSWNPEALKAQAVCARTYAVSSLGNFKKYDYDVAPTIISQVYGGMAAENEAGNRAVDETSHEELFYGTDRVQAFFHSSNGGFCAGSEDVFSTKLPYFRPKVDPYSLKITKPWRVQVQKDTLKKSMDEMEKPVGEVLDLEILAVNPSRIVRKIKVHGTEGSAVISGDRLRSILGGNSVKSLYFRLLAQDQPSSLPSVGGNPAVPSIVSPDLSVLTAGGVQKKDKRKLEVISAGGSVGKIASLKYLAASGEKTLQSIENVKEEPEAPEAPALSGGYPSAVDGERGMLIEGYGWGHNLGMSQWGAKVMAEEGHTYQEILKFYYEGTEIRKN